MMCTETQGDAGFSMGGKKARWDSEGRLESGVECTDDGVEARDDGAGEVQPGMSGFFSSPV